jgi:hypothetical protein
MSQSETELDTKLLNDREPRPLSLEKVYDRLATIEGHTKLLNERLDLLLRRIAVMERTLASILTYTRNTDEVVTRQSDSDDED